MAFVCKLRTSMLVYVVGIIVGSIASMTSAQTLHLGHVLAPSHPFHQGMLHTAEVIAERTDGRISLEVFPASQLGTERDMHVAIRAGGVDMLLASPGGASVHLPELAVLDAPYLFRDDDHWRAVVYGEIGQEWGDRIQETSGVHIVGWFPRGTRHVVSRTRPYESISDIQGQQIRVADIPPYPTVFQAFGAIPTPVAFAEVYSALQTGVVDGADVPLDAVLSMQLHEVTRYVNLIAWSFAAPGPILISDEAWNRVAPEDKDALLEALREGTELIAQLLEEEDRTAMATLGELGMTFITPVDLDAWRQAAVERAIPRLIDVWGGDAELYDRIANLDY